MHKFIFLFVSHLLLGDFSLICPFHNSFCYIFIHKRAIVGSNILLFKGPSISSASLQAFIKELKEVSIEFCKIPLFVLIIDLNSLFENLL